MVGTSYARRGYVEDKFFYVAASQRFQLVPSPSRDDPFDMFRGLLFAVPASALGFWLPALLLMIRLHAW
jgi:hypothetical protein